MHEDYTEETLCAHVCACTSKQALKERCDFIHATALFAKWTDTDFWPCSHILSTMQIFFFVQGRLEIPQMFSPIGTVEVDDELGVVVA